MLRVTRRIMISAPRESVSLYLREVKNLAQYEQKVEKVEVATANAAEAEAQASGRFLGLSWNGTLKFVFTADGGYTSELVKGSLSRMTGDFHLRPVSGGTVLTHDEEYVLPLLFRPLAPLVARWVSSTMESELGVIKEGAELLNRKLQLQKIEKV